MNGTRLKANIEALNLLFHVFFREKMVGPVDQSGMIAAFASQNLRFRRFPSLENVEWSPFKGFLKDGCSERVIEDRVRYAAEIRPLSSES